LVQYQIQRHLLAEVHLVPTLKGGSNFSYGSGNPQYNITVNGAIISKEQPEQLLAQLTVHRLEAEFM
jgi:hypothetical protein